MLDKGERDDWFASHFIVLCAVLGAAGLICAIIWELRQKEPLVDLRLFKQRNYSMATFMMFALGVIMYGTTVLLPIQLQSLMGYTAEWAGLVLSPGGIMTLLVMPFVGRLLGIFQPRWLVVVGLVILSVGMYQLSSLNLQTSFWTFVLTWSISRTGMPFLFVPINVMAFAYVPREKTNNATGLINLTRNLGGSVGISMVTAVQTRFAQVSQNNLVGNLNPLNPAYNSQLQHLQGALQAAGSNSVQAAAQAHAILYGDVVRHSAMLAYIDVFRILSWACVAMIPLMFMMKPAKNRGGASAAAASLTRPGKREARPASDRTRHNRLPQAYGRKLQAGFPTRVQHGGEKGQPINQNHNRQYFAKVVNPIEAVRHLDLMGNRFFFSGGEMYVVIFLVPRSDLPVQRQTEHAHRHNRPNNPKSKHEINPPCAAIVLLVDTRPPVKGRPKTNRLLLAAIRQRMVMFGIALADFVQVLFPSCRMAIGAALAFLLGVFCFAERD